MNGKVVERFEWTNVVQLQRICISGERTRAIPTQREDEPFLDNRDNEFSILQDIVSIAHGKRETERSRRLTINGDSRL